MKNIKFLMLVLSPFVLFLIGYIGAYFFIQKSYVIVPNILGKTLPDAAVLLSQRGLFLSVLKEVEDSSAKDGAILQQLPAAGQQSKNQKPVYVTIARQFSGFRVPAFFGLEEPDIQVLAKKTKLTVDVVKLETSYTSRVCFAQDPLPGDLSLDRQVRVYVALDKKNLCLVPDVRGLVYDEAIAMLARVGITHELFNVRDAGELILPEHKIIDQRPRAGTFIERDKGFQLQIQVD